MRLSKSKIFSFKTCKYRFFMENIKKWKGKKIPPQLKKGIEIHEMFEHAYDGAEYNNRTIVKNSLVKHKDYEKYKLDCDNFIDWEAKRNTPLFREIKFFDEELNFSGVVDRIDIDKDGKIVLIDYKTGKGKKYISAYREELAYYVYLFEKKANRKIDKWGIFFSTSGRDLIEDVKREYIEKAKNKIKVVRLQIKECIDKNEWKKAKSGLCGWCSLYQNGACEGEDNMFDEVKLKR